MIFFIFFFFKEKPKWKIARVLKKDLSPFLLVFVTF